MSHDELMLELGKLRKKMIEGRNIFRADVQLTNSFNCPNRVTILCTMIIGSLIEGKSLESENWMAIKKSFNPYEDFRQKVINYDPLCMSMKVHEMVALMLEENKEHLQNIFAKSTELHDLLWRWMHVVLKLKQWSNTHGENFKKHLFQTRALSDVSIHFVCDEE